MAILKTLKRVFGFGQDPDEENFDSPSSESASSANSELQLLPINSEDYSQTVDMIFTTVVKIFNNSLPTFLSQSVDGEKQKQLLYQALDQDLKKYLEQAEKNARLKGESAWQAEKENMLAEAELLRKKAESLEEKRVQIKEMQLSADRQKRALADRVRDLETQLLRLEAEKEQLDLENKSMMNKAKAASILENELQALRGLSAEPGENLALTQAQTELAELKQQLADTIAENQKLKEGLDTLNAKIELNDAMASDFKRQAASSTQQIKELKAATDSKQQELLAKEARIADLENKVLELEARCEDTVDKTEIEEIQRQLDMFEDVKKKMDAHIAKLKAALSAAQSENEALRDTIKENLTRHSQQQKKMQERIEALEQQVPETNDKDIKPSNKPSKKQYASEVDELISGADWLVSVPKEESPMRLVQESEDFGYNAPARKNKSAENEAQLSLFDLL